jgi:FixJ family two-component response regulator
VEKWAAYRSAICVLITDLNLPGELTGWDLAATLEKEDPELRIILTSGEPLQSDMPLDGRRSYLEKPYDTAALLDVVARSCAHLTKAD